MMKVVVLALLCTSTVAQLDKAKADFEKLQASKHSIPQRNPTHNYAADCWTKAHLPIMAESMSLLQAEEDKNVPGAGIKKFKPFEEVLKDGFAVTKCVKDYMYTRGDKFGDNKHDYKLGPVSNVSIVHYNAFVRKEDRAPMTPARCFEFCRTVPNMGFFGIVNGRGCYCTPYFTPMESDSSQCDAGCEGDATQMCGGKSKSSIFTMHFCDSTAADLSLKVQLATAIEDMMRSAVKKANALSDDMQNMAADLQKSLGAVGDSGAANLMQDAKVWAGELVHTAEDTQSLYRSLDGLQKDAKPLKDMSDPATVTKAERVMEGVDDTAAAAKVLMKKLMLQESQASGAVDTPGIFEMMQPAEPEEEEGMKTEEMGSIVATNIQHAIDTNKYFWGPWKFLGWYYSGCTSGACSHRWTEDSCAKKAANTPECMGHFTRWHMEYDGKYRNWPHPYTYEYCYCIGAPVEQKKLNTCHWCERSVKLNWHWQYTVQMWAFDVEVPFSPFAQYYPAMYFVDKDYEKVPATCSGPLAAKPIVSASKDACASSCDANIHTCVGFQYFKQDGKELCFLFSRFNTGFYYTGCGKSFLQVESEKAPYEAGCYAKLSKFVGTDLTPNPSGKCAQCFKTLTKADRCFK
jgi:hypothetical protein